MSLPTVQWPLRIYYDRSCPLCAHEMHALIAHDAHANLQLVDSSAADFADADAAAAGITPADMSRLIHACDANGRWIIGVEVFVLAYQAVGLDSIARLWAHPWLRPIWDRFYPWFARNRMALSRLGIAPLYGWLIEGAARRAARRSAQCAQDRCERE